MFNKDFYPTPIEVIEQMTDGLSLAGKVILEPSAGKGNIVDYCAGAGANVLTCEINSDLAAIVKQKSSFLKPDFLEVVEHEISHIDAIIMNPPFTADEKHILHAWNVAPSGCHIVSLCNWQTLSNDYSRYRKNLLHLVETYGNSVNLGEVFTDAERKTGIEVGLINLWKPKVDNDFADYFDSEEDEPERQENGIMSYNAVREVVQRYVSACKLYDQVIENGIKMNDLVGVLGVSNLTFTCTNDKITVTKSDFQKQLQKKAWEWIFKKMDMGKYMTNSLKSELNKFVEKQVNVPFTMKNIYKMFELVVFTHDQRMDKALLEIFDKLTTHYHDNRFHIEGWKTNSHYMVNRKFILEGVVGQSWSKSGFLYVEWGRRNAELLDDLFKALCYLTGQQYNQNNCLHTFVSNEIVTKIIDGKSVEVLERVDRNFGQWYTWGFFEIKGFKKGTVHCKFIDEKVWDKFNRRVAKLKGFVLPENI